MAVPLTKITIAAAGAAFLALTALAETSDAKDWRRSVDNHYDAVSEARYVPRGDNPQWNFTRSEEHTSEIQSLMRISYAVFCLKKKNKHQTLQNYQLHTSHKLSTLIPS